MICKPQKKYSAGTFTPAEETCIISGCRAEHNHFLVHRARGVKLKAGTLKEDNDDLQTEFSITSVHRSSGDRQLEDLWQDPGPARSATPR